MTCLAGTRPEAVKLAPVAAALRLRSDLFDTAIVVSGQQLGVAELLEDLNARPDVVLPPCREPAPAVMTGELLIRLSRLPLMASRDLVIVQGDTTTSFAGALTAFHGRVPVAHVEAGLRTRRLDSPFPEEAHRQMIARLAALHFAPTVHARGQLLEEGIPACRISVTGNTVVDTLLQHGCDRLPSQTAWARGRRLVVVTLHRRESWGKTLAGMCDALAELARRYADVDVLLPLHPNPQVRRIVCERLGAVERVTLRDHMGYREFMACLASASLVLTDSGGVQEEAVTLGKPVLVLRAASDRAEPPGAGVAHVVGTSAPEILHAAVERLNTAHVGSRRLVYGDGRAGARIALALSRWERGLTPALPDHLQFDAEVPDAAAQLDAVDYA